MTVYTKLLVKDIQKVLRHYNLTYVQSLPLSEGNCNTNYFIEAKQGKFLLTISEHLNYRELKENIHLLNHLRSRQFETNEIVHTKEGGELFDFMGKPGYLKKWIDGTVYSQLKPKQLFSIGKQLAKLHLISSPTDFRRKHSYGIATFSKIIGKGGDDQDFEQFILDQISFLENALSNPFPSGLLHGDLFADNIVFGSDEQIFFIDFEEACLGYFVFDIGMTAIGTCVERENINNTKLKALISGYQSKRKMSSVEIMAIPLYMYYSSLVTAVWRYGYYNIAKKRPGFERKHGEMMRLAKNIAHNFLDF